MDNEKKKILLMDDDEIFLFINRIKTISLLQNITIVFLTSVTEETEEKRSGGLYEKAV
jgi:hypothetical protein